MGGIKCQPTELSTTEVERVAHAFTQQIYDVIGDNSYILLPDLGTNAQVCTVITLQKFSLKKIKLDKPCF